MMGERFVQSRREQACSEMNIQIDRTSYADIMQRLVRRYLFKLEREKINEGTCIFVYCTSTCAPLLLL